MILYSQPLKITLEVDDPTRPLVNLLNEAVVRATLHPSDPFLTLMNELEFIRRGYFTWSIAVRGNSAKIRKFLTEYSAGFIPNTITDKSHTQYLSYQAGISIRYNHEYAQPALHQYSDFREDLVEAIGHNISDPGLHQQYKDVLLGNQRNYNRLRNRIAGNDAVDRTEFMYNHHTLGGVELNFANDSFWVRVYPTTELAEMADTIYMARPRNVKRSAQTYLPVRRAVDLLNNIAEKWTGDIFDEEVSETAFELMKKIQNVVTVGYAPNQPAKAILTVGANVTGTHFKTFKPNKETKISVTRALDLAEKVRVSRTRTPKPEFLFHPALNDIVNMTKAKAYKDEPRLMAHQKEAVGLHLATEIGYLQTCEPGMGKTVIQLVAMRARAEKIANYRGLVMCESNVRHQWAEEAAIWFPNANVVNISGPDDAEDLATALGSEGPVVVLATYNRALLAHSLMEYRKEKASDLATMKFDDRMKALLNAPIEPLTVGSMMLDTYWDDIAADEAVIIRNGTSKQSAALWEIRKNSGVAVALTATPVNKSPDDIARLASWVRNDKNLFTGKPLSERYDTTTAVGGKALFDAFGPLIFRRDASIIADKMPKGRPDVQILTPSPAEAALASAAEHELKRCYLELMAAVEEVERTSEGTDADAVKAVKENLRAANGAWLGGTQLARMATSDPTALLGSQSVGAALLAGQGLIDAALVDEPTKRRKFIQIASKKVSEGKQLLVFTEFVDVAKTLVKALQENGINAQSFTGQNTKSREQARKDFQDGKVDVLVCTQAAERGLTLHKASTIVHYDLPWTLEKVIQRTGRGIRIGSENEVVDIVFLVLEGTIEERISNRLMELGISASMILDNSRGANVANTETAKAMGGLLNTMSRRSDKNHLREFGAEFLGIAAA